MKNKTPALLEYVWQTLFPEREQSTRLSPKVISLFRANHFCLPGSLENLTACRLCPPPTSETTPMPCGDTAAHRG